MMDLNEKYSLDSEEKETYMHRFFFVQNFV